MTADDPATTDRPIPARRVPDDAVLALLRTWVHACRWFPAKGTDATLERIAVIDLPDPSGDAEVQVHLLALPTGIVLQVPIVLRHGDVPGVIGRVAGATVVDGPHDPAFVRAWLAAATHDGPLVTDLTGMHVTSGEQSNTSVLLPATSPPTILKVFRMLTLGPNPDVDVPLALSRAGWSGVPRPLAWLTGSWTGVDGRPARGHLGVLSELVVGAQDGFRLACEMAARGEDFGGLAEDLGRTTAQLHRALRVALPIRPGRWPTTARAAEVRHVTRTLRERAKAAIERAPVLADRRAAIDGVYAGVDRLPAVPPLQRVHGDYHLGQVLRSGDGRWYVLDFEGEPQAAASEKTRPDLALRDVAGMLRSFDYAASIGGAPDGWVRSARKRLVAGYQAENGDDRADLTVRVLLRALELDKAIYEVVYESGNRPDWLHIPLDGVDRLLAD